ncbi:hypothetical protein IX332_000555 [Porphyromonas levii]|uniref:glycoside hydrolase family 20 protein n=1 Tax=Porphyromonas levii TaxID=28114 RepID=UPI001B8C4B72|nr:family 20 glycosylhydrolase [Porphyromonas levii]MBR8729241.1 hypothetical protein [Porphyromonas levii]MBR8759383.1 hypothetical protein [Porphyromonas levii]MBR8769512.1 hypothetical protein [Porphyromonas levii]MBR8784790.1 hypothetical protein [Porphyromonas levii]
MKIRVFVIGAVLMALLLSCNKSSVQELSEHPSLIPLPNQLEWKSLRAFTLDSKSMVSIPEEVPNRELLVEQLNETLSAHGWSPIALTTNDAKAAIRVVMDKELPEDTYTLDTDASQKVRIIAGSTAAVGYAIQTLRQLVTDKGIAEVKIADAPRLEYRGVMLDVSRHYMSVDFIKQLLDEMQYYKFNRFHWHLVDAAGWRLQIKQYPELTDKAAYRTDTDWQKWWIEKDRKYLDKDAPGAYGGYYTQDEAREIVAYAAERGITVIPEIEMPGHSEEVLHVFPQLSCSGKALEYESDFCIGNEESFTFLEHVLDEVMEIFPSEYIHIGGDEASKTAWMSCPKCTALMKREGMKEVDELQSYMIHRIESYLNSKGRQIIGWDEILEGGLAPKATVMSWRGEKGGLSAARAGHKVIMTPNTYLYLDYYQEDPTASERKQIGGFVPLEKTYSYNPISSELTPEEQKYIYGVQGNLWTEYIMNEEHAQYMLFPRVLALAEVAWTKPELKDWESFRKRVNVHVPQLHARGVNSYPLSSLLNIKHEINYDRQEFSVTMTTELYPHEIHYRLDGTVPTMADPIYTEGDILTMRDSMTLVAGIFRDGQLLGEPTRLRLDYHKGIGKKVEWQHELGGGYPAGGEETALLDGLRGSITYLDGRWLGNAATQSTIGVIDLGASTELTQVSTKCMHDIEPWIHMPEWVELSVSADGKDYQVVDRVLSQTDPKDTRLRFETFTFYPNTMARYLKIEYHLPISQKFLFADEIVIW